MQHLFVYGTLAPGEINEHVLSGLTGDWRKASVRGHRITTTWGQHAGLPGFYPDPDGPTVEGLIFTSNDLATFWKRLDEFEGNDYQRETITATLEDRAEVDVHIYCLKKRL